MQGGLREVYYTRCITRGVLCEVGYVRYKSPSEIVHSLIFFLLVTLNLSIIYVLNSHSFPIIQSRNTITGSA